LAETSPDVIYILDRTGRLLYANRTAAAYMGLSPESLVGKTQQDLFPPDKAQYHRERIYSRSACPGAVFRVGAKHCLSRLRALPLKCAEAVRWEVKQFHKLLLHRS
jgi:PAS domain-containing protein